MEQAIDPAGDGRYFADFRISMDDGSTRHIVSRGATEFRLGRPLRLIGVVRDDTRRREAQHAESRSEARLLGILSIAADAIISIDEQSRVVLFNQGAEKIFGYASAEIMGKPLEALIPQRLRASHEGHIKRFAGSGVTAQQMGERREVAGLRKDGTEFPAEASISKLVIDGTTTFTVVLRDVTDRKRQELELERRVAERTAELSALLDAVPDGIVQTSPDQHIRVPNAATSLLFGYSREELIGKPANLLFASDQDSAAADASWRALDAGRSSETLTLECRRKDGTPFTAMVRGSVVRGADGQVVSRVGMIRDVTDELKRQKALTAAQRMEAFGQLTGGIAHDFNNLLTVITGNHELLEMRLTDERQIALLKRAQTAAEMGARLTSRLLTFARRRQLATSLLSLNEQITQMVDLLRRSIGEQITLTTNLSPKLPLVKADPSEIENAVLNLAINARDAMPNGGTIVIETSEQIVDAMGLCDDDRLKPGHYVRLSVTDTGCGMAPDVASQAFEPFFTTKPHGKGTGLGLSTIHGFAQQSGGTVTLCSEPGIGTTVSLYLPRVEADGSQTALAFDSETVPVSAGEKVLLVEDNADVRQVARQLLDGLGYEAVEVHNGAAAIDELSKGGAGKYDVVFCDVVMPGGASGFDVARWIGAHAPHVRVLLTSGYPDEVASGHKSDVADVTLLRKPYSRLELARALRQVLDTGA
jgi:PAS domain S-box-containing protein